jgi:hypothetical protein
VTIKFPECPQICRIEQRCVTTCLCYVLRVGEANKAVVAKQWQCYTSVRFRPGGKMSDRSNSELALLFGNIGKVT